MVKSDFRFGASIWEAPLSEVSVSPLALRVAEDTHILHSHPRLGAEQTIRP